MMTVLQSESDALRTELGVTEEVSKHRFVPIATTGELKMLRAALRLTVNQFARWLGLSSTRGIHAWEHGKDSQPYYGARLKKEHPESHQRLVTALEAARRRGLLVVVKRQGGLPHPPDAILPRVPYICLGCQTDVKRRDVILRETMDDHAQPRTTYHHQRGLELCGEVQPKLRPKRQSEQEQRKEAIQNEIH